MEEDKFILMVKERLNQLKERQKLINQEINKMKMLLSIDEAFNNDEEN